MANLKNFKTYGALGFLIPTLALSGCGKDQGRNPGNEYKSDDLLVYYIDFSDTMIVNEKIRDGFNAKTYRDLIEMYGNDFNRFTLNNPGLFNFEKLEDIDIKELTISMPTDEFNFNTLSCIDGLEKLEISINEEANIKGLFEYLNKNDLSNIDLTIKLLDINSSLTFAEQLKNHTITAASVTISSEYTDFYKYIYNVRTPDLKISRICSTSGSGDIIMQLSKVTEMMYYEYINNGSDIAITINNLIISSNNSNVLVSIEKSNNLTIIVPENAKLSAPEGTTLEIEKQNVLTLKEED